VPGAPGALDDLAQMPCRRQAVNLKKAKAKLEEYHQRQRQVRAASG
jgi:hypothetical protein